MIEAMPGVRPRGGPGLAPDLPSSFGDSSVSCYGGNPPQQSFVPSAPTRSRASLAEAAQHARRLGSAGAAARPQQQQQQQQKKKQHQQHQPTSAAATGSAGPYHGRPGAATGTATLCTTQHAQNRPGGNAGHGGHAVHGTYAPQLDLDFSVPRDCESDVYGNSDIGEEEEEDDDDDDSDDGHILDAAAVADDDEPQQQQLHKQQSPWGGAAASAGAPPTAAGAPVPLQRPAAPSQQRPPQHPSPPQALYHPSPPCRPPAGAAPSQSQRALAASFRQSLGRNLRVEVSSPNRRSASLPARDLAQAASPGLEAVARAISQGMPLTAAQQQVCLSAQKSVQQQQQQRQQPHHQAQMKLSNSAPAVTAMYSQQPRIAPSPPAHADTSSASMSTATSGNLDWSFDSDLSPVTRASPEEAQGGAAGVAPQAATTATGGTNRIVRSSSGDKLSGYQEGQRAVAKMRSFSGPLTATLGRSSSQRKQQPSSAMQAQPSLYPTDSPSAGTSRAPAGPQSSDATPANRVAPAQQHRQHNQGRMLQRGGSEPPRDHSRLQQVPYQQASRLGPHASHSAASSPASAHLPLPGSSPSQDDLYPLAGEGPPISPTFPLSRSIGQVPIGVAAGPPAAVISIPKRRAFPDLPKLDIPWKATDSPRSPPKTSQEDGSAPMGMQAGIGPMPVSMPPADQHVGGQHMAGPAGVQAMGGQGACMHGMTGQNVGGQAMPRHGMGGMGGPGPVRKCVSNANSGGRGVVVPGARQGQGGVPHGAGRAVGTNGRRPGPGSLQDGGRGMVRGGPGPSRHAT